MAGLEGQTLIEFKIVSKLGQGGMGTVYAARQVSLNRSVAVKVLPPHFAEDAKFVARFQREAAAAAGLSHPGIVQVYSAGESSGVHYIAMELVDGESLKDRIAREGRIEPREALAITIHVAQALSHAWQKARMIHRDIKPGNILLSTDGHVKVVDFGMVKCLDSDEHITSTGLMLGTPHYISPEQARGNKDIDFRADIYSLGCTLYQMLSGRVPYEGTESIGVILKQINDPPPSIVDVMPDCPPAIVAVLNKMFAKDREQRQQSYDELIAALTAAHDQLQSQPVVIATSRRSRSRDYAVAGAAVIAATAGVLMWSPWEDRVTGPILPGQPFITSTGMELVWIPPGEFMLGGTQQEQKPEATDSAPANSVNREDAKPRKATIQQGFWIGRTEVTVGQWKQFATTTGYVTDAEKAGKTIAPLGPGKLWGDVKGANWKDPHFGFQPGDHHPVSCISWNDAITFCEWLEAHERNSGRLPADYKIRLPTEAEWEYACRAGTQTRYWWGDSQEAGVGRLNWSGAEDGFEFLAPVDHYGVRGRNLFGLADMLGNVWEWCLDEFDRMQAHEECYRGNPNEHVMKGGSARDLPSIVGSASRWSQWPSRSDANFGFRVVMGPMR